jgi:hypothetical protein
MPVGRLRIFSAALLLLSTLWGCTPRDTCYVEIRTVPTATQTAALYLDKVNIKLDPLKNGTAVLRQPIGTAQLAASGPTSGRGGNIANVRAHLWPKGSSINRSVNVSSGEELSAW